MNIAPTPRASKQCLRAALGLARRGLSVHPCWPYSKRPILRRWPERASTDPADIRAWWHRWPRANVAIATGSEARLLVVDVDPHRGGHVYPPGVETETSIPATVVSRTPRRGWHFWLKVPEGQPLPGNSAGKLGPGVDTRCDGGYVVVPPSVVFDRGHHIAGCYRWHPESTKEIAEAPDWLLDRLEASGGDRHTTDPEEWLELVTSGVPEGQRNASIARLAGLLFRRMPSEAEVAAELIACWNLQKCRPPLEPDELRRTLDSIADRERQRRRAWQ